MGKYQVFALKYRPKSFDEVVGQDHIVRTLKNAIKLSRIPHALLFAGHRGVGKTTMARIFAKSLNCRQGPTVTPCNTCTSCIAIQEGKSMDVVEIDGASHRGIDEVRSIRESVRYMPQLGRYRVYIIDEVHMLTQEAFNALLKTLEEPPPHVIFIFATTAPHKVPLTILSRCQRFNFKKIEVSLIYNKLKEIASNEGLTVEDEALLMIAQKADGSLRDAEGLLDQLTSYAEGTITTAHVRELLGLPDEQLFFALHEALNNEDYNTIFNLLEESFDKGYTPKEILDGLIQHYREHLLLLMGKDLGISETKKQHYLQLDESPISLLRKLKYLSNVDRELRGSLLPEAVLEENLMQLASLSPVVLRELLEKIEKLEPSSLTEPSPPVNLKASTEPHEKPETKPAKPEMPEIVAKAISLFDAELINKKEA